MNQKFCSLLLGIGLIMLEGCFLDPDWWINMERQQQAETVDTAIARYQDKAREIHIGDPQEKVLSVLLPTQAGLPPIARKSPEGFRKDNHLVEIHYFRSGRQPDGLTTDDEFTPYVFTDGALTSIGWTALGGPKTVGQSKKQDSSNSKQTICMPLYGSPGMTICE